MRKTYLLILSIIFFFLVLDCVSAIGIGPPRVNLDFTPGLSQNFEYIAFNNLAESVKVDMYVKGDLSQYITLDKESAVLPPGGRTTFIASVRLPQQIDIPGMHEIKIGAVSSSLSAQQGTVGAKAAVESQLNIFVPYQGKYLIASLEATSVESGEKANFTIKISNKGLENISNVNASIDIYLKDQLIATVYTENKNMNANNDDYLHASWLTAGAASGTYKAIAKINYDGNSKEIQTDFNVGSALAEITDINVSKFSKGEIAKITVKAKSFWNKPIDNVYAAVDFSDKDDKVIETIKSSPESINPMSEKNLTLFWDTKEIESGEYKAKAILHYLDKTAEKSFSVSVKKENNLLIMLPIGAVIALLIYILWKIIFASVFFGRKK